MKKMSFVLLGLSVISPAKATEFTVYDPTFYAEVNYPKDYPAGTLTGVSDIYYTLWLEDKHMTVSQTEWLSTGGIEPYEEPAPYDSVFNYYDVSLDNMIEIFSSWWTEWDKRVIYGDFKQQITDYYREALKTGKMSFEAINDIPLVIRDDLANYIASFVARSEINLINHARANFNENISLVSDRLHQKDSNKITVWSTELYGVQKFSTFDTEQFGIAAGVGNNISDNLMIGLGVLYKTGNIDSSNILLKNDSYNMFVYGRYVYNKLDINSILSYNLNSYKYGDTSNKYSQTSSFGGVFNVGINTKDYLTPEIGIRYLFVSNDMNGINSKNEINKTITTTMGTKCTVNIENLSLNLSANVLYDIVNKNNLNNRLNSDDFKPLGLELGLDLVTNIDNLKIGISYNYGVRSEFQSHTGILKIEYSF